MDKSAYPNTDFLQGLQHQGENVWVMVEKHVTGKTARMAGKQSSNLHLVMEGTDETLTISATEQQLAGEPYLCDDVTLRIAAEQHLKTKQLRNARLIEFVPASQEVDEGALARLWEKGRVAWQEVAGAASWVEKSRGH